MNDRCRTHYLRPPLSTAALALALAGFTSGAAAQQPLGQASVESLVAALSVPANGGLATRSFRRTQLPEAGSNLCGEAAKPAPRPTGGAERTGSGGNGGARTRTLEVVPYAGDTTPGVNLSVQFATGSDRLAAADRQLLDNVATALKTPALANESFAVAGHTDASGDARLNLELSCARALAVRRYLVDKGIADTRLSAYGFGSARPLDGGDAAAPVNRRVEVRKAPQ
ncbi:MAG: OmpA family protein [Burkholderiaceae bacterium]|nr:OmpA family protein [Burkholderiaceae bacterium]